MKDLTVLEKEMLEAMKEKAALGIDSHIAAAEVCKKWIEKAYGDGYYAVACIDPEMQQKIEQSNRLPVELLYEDWLKSNRII